MHDTYNKEQWMNGWKCPIVDKNYVNIWKRSRNEHSKTSKSLNLLLLHSNVKNVWRHKLGICRRMWKKKCLSRKYSILCCPLSNSKQCDQTIVIAVNITIHMPQRTSKILLVRLTANRNALLFLIRVTSFARYTVWFGVTRSDETTVNDYFTLPTSLNFKLEVALIGLTLNNWEFLIV